MRAPTTHAAPLRPPHPEPIRTRAPSLARARRYRPAPREAQRGAAPAPGAQRGGAARELEPAEGRRSPRLCSGRGGPAGARLTLLLGSMAALRRRLWQRRVRGRGRADGRRGALRLGLLLRFGDSDCDSDFGPLASCSLASSLPSLAAHELRASPGYL